MVQHSFMQRFIFLRIPKTLGKYCDIVTQREENTLWPRNFRGRDIEHRVQLYDSCPRRISYSR